MISYIKGIVKLKEQDFAIVVVNDIGYKVLALGRDLARLKEGDMAEFFTYHYIREDDMRLYGFAGRDDQKMFELLFSVTGIGPKSAMGILNAAPIESIKSAIANDDTSLLTKVSGVGKRTAERVVLELAGKVDGFGGENKNTEGLSDAIEGLMSLGYSRAHALKALEKVPEDITDPAQKIRLALKSLGKK